MAEFSDQSVSRVAIFKWVAIVIFALYGINLFSLQVVKGYIYSENARRIHQRQEVLQARRGTIYDRNQNILGDNEYRYEVFLELPTVEQESIDKIVPKLSRLLRISSENLHAQISSAQRQNVYDVTLSDNLSLRDISYLIEHQEQFPGVKWRTQIERQYPYKDVLAHVTGYLGAISTEELQSLYNQGGYSQNTRIGKSGVEQIYDSTLRGINGQKVATVDVYGNEIEVDNIIAPIDGHDIVLTIDANIQQLVSDALGSRTGAAVVLKPGSGEILALASYPSFDPNRFSGRDSERYFRQLNNQQFSPFINRAIQSTNPPASTFKILMTSAIIEERAFRINERIYCPGFFELGNAVLYDWDRRNFGWLNIFEGLANSSNVFFWTVATQYLGVDHIVDYSYRFGLGKQTGIDLPNEVAGIVPDPEWKYRIYDERWSAGDTANLAIGQGYLGTTPLQIANVVAAVANGGKIFRPHVLKEIRDKNTGEVISATVPEEINDINLRPDTIEHVKRALRSVVTDGTSRSVITTDLVRVAGKTGTGEVIKGSDKFDSWFVAYAPIDAPVSEQVVVVVLVDASNEWEWWAPKAANIILHGIFSEKDYQGTVEQLRNSSRGLWYL